MSTGGPCAPGRWGKVDERAEIGEAGGAAGGTYSRRSARKTAEVSCDDADRYPNAENARPAQSTRAEQARRNLARDVRRDRKGGGARPVLETSGTDRGEQGVARRSEKRQIR